MKRQIKFRVWNGNSYRYDQYNSDLDFIEDQGGRFSRDHTNFGTAKAIQQFTGLQDKNGKDIYEGDILIYKYKSVYEIWNDKEFIGWSKDVKDFYSLHRVDNSCSII